MAKRRILNTSVLFLRHVIPATMKPARIIWNELIGYLFLAFTAIFSFQGYRYWRDYHDGDTGSLLRVVMSVVCAAILGFYGLSSLRRARRISRS